MSPGQTEVKKSKFVKFISPTNSHFRETYKSQNIYPIFPTPKFALNKGVSASKIFVTMLLHTWFPLIWYATWPCSDKTDFFYLLTPYPRVMEEEGGLSAKICYHVAAFMIPFNLICNMTMFDKSWLLTYLLGQEHGGLWAKYLLLFCCISWSHLIWYATWPCSEKVEFWPIDPIPMFFWGGGGGGSAGKICWNHVAAIMIPFNLICNMTLFW